MENIEQQELDKFNRVSEHWWDFQGPFKPLHRMNPVRLAYIQKHCHLSGRQVLDVGCGGGILSESLAKSGALVHGIDMAEQALEVARQHAKDSGLDIQYALSSCEAWAQGGSSGQYDVVTCLELLEHVPNPESVIQACAQLLKSGGRVFFSTINRNAKAMMLAILGAEYIAKLVPKGTHEYAKFIRPSELNRVALEVGLQLDAMTGITYKPLTQRFELSSNVDVNYMMCFVKD